MSKRNRNLRTAEILLAAVFVVVLFAVEGAVVANLFRSSMKNALNKITSSINESNTQYVDEFEQQLWAEERMVTLAGYYLENDATETDTEESLSNLCRLFNADGAYLIQRNGKMLVGYGPIRRRIASGTSTTRFCDPSQRKIRTSALFSPRRFWKRNWSLRLTAR